MGVGEAVEASGGALGVSAHVLEVEPVSNIQGVVEADRLGDVVNAVAGWAEDGVLNSVIGLRGGGLIVDGTSTGAKNLCDWVLVVEHDAREVAIDTIVEVDHVGLLARGWARHRAASNDVAGQCECGGDVVPPWLSDHVDVGWNVLLESIAENNGHGLKVLARESASDIDGVHLVSKRLSLVHYSARIADSLEESQWVASSRSDVEGDTNDVQAKLLGDCEELLGGVQRSTELHAEATQAGGVIGDNADEKLSIREEFLDLVKLVGVVESHLLDSVGRCVADVGVGLAWLSVDDAGWLGAHLKNLLDLGLGGTVETGAERLEQTKDHWVWVALDG